MLTDHQPIFKSGLSFALVGILLSQPVAVNADDILKLFFAGQRQVQPSAAIGVGDTVQGTLDQSDETLSDGRPVDTYTFTATSGQTYVVTVISADFPARSVIGSADTLLQQANVFGPGFQVQYSGTINTGGSYAILVSSADSSLPTGGYTLSFAEANTPVVPGDCSTGGTVDNPILIELNQPLDCQLAIGDDQFESGRIVKAFNFNSPGGAFTITATSTAYTPVVFVPDPASGEGMFRGMPNSLEVSFPPGIAFFLISTENPGQVGNFNVVIENSAATPASQVSGEHVSDNIVDALAR